MHKVPADRRNAPGDFYVSHGCCTLCGVPWHYAPDLFAYDEHGCWVKQQPRNSDELRKMVEVIRNQELGCINYQGTDPEVIKLISRDR